MVHVNQSLSCIRSCRTDLVSIVSPVSLLVFLVIRCTLSYRFWKVFGPRLLILYFLFFGCNCSSESRSKSRIQTVRECFLHAFKDLLVDVMCFGVDREWQRRRRFHSEDALDSLRLKNSRAGYLSRITKLYRETEELLKTQRISMKFRRNYWTLTKPLLASRRRITITLPLIWKLRRMGKRSTLF